MTPAAIRSGNVLATAGILLAVLAGCAGEPGGTAASGAAGARAGAGSEGGVQARSQARTLPPGASEARIRRFCTIEARRQAESIPAIQSGKTSYTGGKDHDFGGCLKRNGL